jgi:hypothetical protein
MQIDPQTSQFFLESSNWNVEVAINTYLSTVGNQGAVYQVTSPPQAAFLTDLSQLQTVQFPPLTPIQMTWSFRNIGPHRWPGDSRLVFVDGHRLNGPDQCSVVVDAGQQADIPVQLVTPAEAGIYAGTWRLTCGSGYFSEPLWLVVTVVDADGEAMTEAMSNFSMASAMQQQQAAPNNPFQAQSQFSQPTQQPLQQQQQQQPGGVLQQPMFSFQQPAQATAQQQQQQTTAPAPSQQVAPVQAHFQQPTFSFQPQQNANQPQEGQPDTMGD